MASVLMKLEPSDHKQVKKKKTVQTVAGAMREMHSIQ